MFPADFKELQALFGAVDGVLAQSLHVNSGLWLLVDGKGVLSLRVSQHVVKLFVVELDETDPYGGLSIPTGPAGRLCDASTTSRTQTALKIHEQRRRWVTRLGSGCDTKVNLLLH